MNEEDAIPTHWHRDQMLTGKDALAMVTFLAFLLAPMGLMMYAVGKWFGIVSGIPVKDQLHGRAEWLLLGAFIVGDVAAVLVGKYLWLISMSPVLSKASVGPLVAYGLPRRISRLDKTIMDRWCNQESTHVEVKPSKGAAYTCRLHGIAYGAGAVLAIGLSFLPMMRNDPRFLSLAFMFSVLALLCFGMALWARK